MYLGEQMNNKTAKWKEAALQKIAQYSNLELMEETLNLARGDDYDGCFTERGNWEYGALTVELAVRLRAAGFLGDSETL